MGSMGLYIGWSRWFPPNAHQKISPIRHGEDFHHQIMATKSKTPTPTATPNIVSRKSLIRPSGINLTLLEQDATFGVPLAATSISLAQ